MAGGGHISPDPAASAGTASGLTNAERRVAEMVANGASNTEVAATLFVNRKTVETHLSSVYRKLGLRSRSQLARAWALAEPPGRLSVPPALHGVIHEPLIGRDDEQARLMAALHPSHPRVASISGEPGIGKSRLCAWLAEQAVDAGVPVVYGRCRENPVHSLEPFAELLAPLIEANPPVLDHLTRPHRQALGSLVAGGRILHEPGPDPNGDLQRLRLADAIARTLDAAASKNGLLAIYEDLHWATGPMLPILRWLLTGPVRARALTVLTLREAAGPLALHSFFDDVARHVPFETVELGALDVDEVAQLVQRVAPGTRVAGGELARTVHDASGGRPFFVLELLRVLPTDLDPVPADPLAFIEMIPSRARDAVRRRIEQLPPSTQSSLAVAAVCGDESDLVTLAAATGSTPAETMESLLPAIKDRILVEDRVRPGRLRFAHALGRHAILNGLSLSQRRLVHARVATALESVGGDHVDELSYHTFEAVPIISPSSAIASAQRAAKRSASRNAHEDAVTHYRRLVELYQGGGDSTAQTYTAALALTRHAASGADGVTMKAAGLVAREMARALGQPWRLTDVAVARGQLKLLGEHDESQFALIDEALDATTDAPSKIRLIALRARLTSSSARSLGDDQTMRSVAEARLLGDPELVATALLGRCWYLGGDPGGESLLPYAEELIATTERLRDPVRSAIAHAMAAWAHQIELEHGKLAMEWAAVETEAQSAYLVPQLVAMPGRRSYLAMAAGRLAEAFELLDEPVGPFRAPEDILAVQQLLRLLISIERGQAIDRALIERVAHSVIAPTLPVLDAWTHALAGDTHAARRSFEGLASSDFDRLSRNIAWRCSLQMLTDVCSALGDTQRARLLYALALPHRTQSSNAFTFLALSSMERCCGQLAAMIGDLSSADRHFAAALASDRRNQAHLWEAQTLLAWSMATAALGHHERSRRCASEAMHLANRHHLTRVGHAADRVLTASPRLSAP